jgi:outer membrane biosynthesis protein TonB
VKTTGTRNSISAATLAGDRRSPAGWAGSLALHGAIIIGTLFTVTHTLDIADQSAPVVPIDLVTIAQKTNIRASAHHERHIAPNPTPPTPKEMPEPPQVQPQPPPAPTPPQPQPTPPKAAAAEPLAEAPQPVIPKHRPQPPAKQQEVKPQQTQPKDDTKKSFDVDKVLALLNKVAPSKAAAPDAPEAPRNVRGFGAQNAMTADLQDALRSQIQRCWNPPVGAPHPERLVVSFDLFLNPDGSVAQPPQSLDNSDDPFFHAAKEAALRAIYTCAPYKLPGDRYAQWKEIKPFVFDPRQMLGEQ